MIKESTMFNITPKELAEYIDNCVSEQLNDWLDDCTTEEIALMLCVARTHRAALPTHPAQ